MKVILAGLVLCLVVVAGGCSTGAVRGVDDIHSLSDQQLATEVFRRIRYDMPPQQALTIGVTANGSVVTLHGSVERPETRARAVSTARGTPGVTEVVDQITTKF